MNTVWKVLTRKKVLDPVSTEQSELGRVLNTLDLTALGVGSTLGVGVYVLAGHVAKDTAGPSVVLSFLIATVASVFAGLCYAEFGARAPRAGSAYIYSYVCVGEFIAFIIGWNLILEYVIGSASVARGLSLYLDTLINNTLQNTFIDIAPLGNVSFMSPYFDFFAFGVSILLAIALAFGLKESSLANNIFTFVNLLVVVFVVIAGSVYAKSENWKIPANTTDSAIGEGGFFPFGVEGMIKGAATCFYGFVGFDCIATTGEEVRNPKKAIPFAIVLSLFIIFLAYFGTSTVVTLMIPYYEQDPNAPLPHAFASVGQYWAKWVVAIGGIFGLCASLFGAMFPLPRIIYAMASDSIIFQFLGKVSLRFKTPVVGTLLAGLLTGLMAALFNLKQLVNMMSIGTLLAYTIVAASVLLLRYTENRALDIGGTSDEVELISDDINSNVFKQIFNCGRQQYPSELSEKIVKIEVCVYCLLCVGIGLCAMYLKTQIANGEIWAIVITAVIVALAVLILMSMITQPKSRKELSFKVPLVPLIPALSILINIYLMLMLDPNTWIRFGVWMAVGIPTYYFSVKTPSDARNESICSRTSIASKEKPNGYTNHAFEADEIKTEPKKRPAPPPPTSPTAVIADLDEMLENVEANLNERKYSADSLSTSSNILHKENVQADVHCSDVSVTPANVPLLQSNVTCSNPVPNDVADTPIANSEFDFGNKEPKTETVVTNQPVETVETQNTQESHDSSEQIKPEESRSNSEEKPEEHRSDPEEKQVESQERKSVSEETEITRENLFMAIPNPEEKTISEMDNLSPQVVATIPTPPPFLLQLDDQVDGHVPRPIFTVAGFKSVKLKPVQVKRPETPPVDYSRQNSAVPPPDTNIKFGTPEYKEFKEKLGNQLQQGYSPIPEFKKKPVTQNVHVSNENVIEDKVNRDVVREKLTQFLERTNSLPANVVRDGFAKSAANGNNKPEKIDEKDLKEQHRQNMQSVFRSVRLNKEDSFKEKGPNNVQNSIGAASNPEKRRDSVEYKEQHRRNMQNIFRSVRLRKEDSFRDKPQNKINGFIPSIVSGGNDDDRLDHQRNMVNIFRSIKLRKVDSFKQDESQ